MTAHLRWMIGRDLSQVLEIESQLFDYPWTSDEFAAMMRDNDSIGMVAELDDSVIGYMVYGLRKTHRHLTNFAVRQDHQRQGVGRQMIEKLKSKLHPDRRTRIRAEVRETNLAAQLFFKAMGFRAVNILKNCYQDCNDDAYVMLFRCEQSSELCVHGEPW